MVIDGAMYPDREIPEILATDGEQVDYVDRVYAAEDFVMLTLLETFGLFRNWRDIFDKYPKHLFPGLSKPRRNNPLPAEIVGRDAVFKGAVAKNHREILGLEKPIQ